MRTNLKAKLLTAEGGCAGVINAEQQLLRCVMSCLLFEGEFYEDGATIAERIKTLAHTVSADFLASTAIKARSEMHLRHVPLYLVNELSRHKGHSKFPKLVQDTLYTVIQRADELAEFLAIYWAEGRHPLSAQVKKGLSRAFNKFSEYDFAKYNRDGYVKLRDALFVCHAKPADVSPFQPVLNKNARKRIAEQLAVGDTAELVGLRPSFLSPKERLFGKLVAGDLDTPDTWETNLSAGADKATTFKRLMMENKLGGLAFLRNLRNMSEAGVNKAEVRDYAGRKTFGRVLPFRFLAAARHVPQWEDIIEPLMMKCISGHAKLVGHTVLLVDVSGSMQAPLSVKSQMQRLDAAYGLAVLLREICADISIFTFSDLTVHCAPRRGFALRDLLERSQIHNGTYLSRSLSDLSTHRVDYDRIIVITDEQTHDGILPPLGRGYVINVASAANGVGYGPWMHIDGFSESVIDYIIAYESAFFCPANQP